MSLIALFGLACSPGPEPAPAIAARTSALSTPKPCVMATLPGKDPGKLTAGLCPPAQATAVAPSLVAKQQAYLAAWQAQAASWTVLSAAERQKRLTALKESFLGKGDQP